MSVRRKLADAFRALPNRGLAARYLRSHPNAVNGSVYVLAAQALEQLAQPPRPGLVARLKAKVAAQAFAIRDLEAAERERVDNPPREDLLNMVRGLALRGITDYAGVWSWLLALEAVAASALDDLHDRWGSDDKGPPTQQALEDELHRAGLFDAEEGCFTTAGEELALRVARRGSTPDHALATTAPVPYGCPSCGDVSDATAPGACRKCSAVTVKVPSCGACAEALFTGGVWTAHDDGCALRGTEPRIVPEPYDAPRTFSEAVALANAVTDAAREAGLVRAERALSDVPGAMLGPLVSASTPRPLRVYVAGGSSEVELVARYVAALRAAGVEVTHDWTPHVPKPGEPWHTPDHARADIDGVERADLVWWILPAALSEGSAFEAGYALGRAKRSVVSGAWAEHGRVFPSLLSELWSTHDAALAAIVSLAAERRAGGQIPTS